MEVTDLIGHVAYLSLLLGHWTIGLKRRWGWLARATGGVVWMWIGFEIQMTSIMLWSGVFTCVDLWNWWRWRDA